MPRNNTLKYMQLTYIKQWKFDHNLIPHTCTLSRLSTYGTLKVNSTLRKNIVELTSRIQEVQ